ncbi:uncharacterized protein LOC129921210 [Episyrphus balteatus]|uniref:uncharacterized protein LOC129921210 n=1 Tax=Episyrphus balteatus TaxID=286459 RepID=UPI002486C90B|nr:uncharacterized protein LOC129921210 [Episyrphus balteatus]
MLDRGDSSQTRYASPGIFGRFPFGKSEPFQTRRTGYGSRSSSRTIGLEDKLQKISIGSRPKAGILGRGLGYLQKYYVSAGREGQQNSIIPSDNVAARFLHSSSFATSFRPVKFRQLCCTQRSTPLSISSDFLEAIQHKAETKTHHPSEGFGRVRLVARSPTEIRNSAQDRRDPFSGNGCFGYRLGCSAEREVPIRPVVKSSKAMALQFKRNVRCSDGDKETGNSFEECTHTSPIGQSNFGCVHTQGGRNKVSKPTKLDVPTSPTNRSAQYNSIGILPSGKVQRNSRQVVKGPSNTRMASSPSGNCGSFQKVGVPRDRSICFQKICDSSQLCVYRQQRPGCKIHKCFQPSLGSRSSVDLSTTQPNAKSTSPPKQVSGHLSNSISRMGPGFLDERSQGSGAGTTLSYSEPTGGPGGRDNGAASPSGRKFDPESMDSWGWSSQIINWSTEEKNLLKRGWRQSTLKTYSPAIKKWLTWCEKNNINPKSPTGSCLARYLASLFIEDKYASSTILVHKSAISTFCDPMLAESLPTNFFVRRILRAIGSAQPSSERPSIWDPRSVFNWLASENETIKDSLFEASRRTASILLLASGRRVHDLTLLKLSSECYKEEEESIIFHPSFGSKTDSAKHRQSSWLLLCHENKKVCPVYWVKQLIRLSQPRRVLGNNLDSLFITVNGAVKPASRTVIGTWIRTILRDAGVGATPGSFRAAVASLGWLEKQPIDDILARGNWKTENTFRKHYCKEINSDVVRGSPFLFKNFKPI